MRASKAWQVARKIPKKKRAEAFKSAMEEFNFSSASVQKFAEQCRDACWIGEHLGSHDTQTTSLRAFKSVQQYVFGKRGRPRFKGRNRLRSVEGKGDAVVRFRTVAGIPMVLWAGLSLPLLLDPRDRDGWQAQALKCKTKYVRVLRRTIGSTIRWYCQLVQEGKPPHKERNKVGSGIIGLDLGPSTIAIVAKDAAHLETFCAVIEVPAKEIKLLQRAMVRSRRATNPFAYNPDGTYKRGARISTRSRRYKALAASKADLERRLASERKRAQGELANQVLSLGNTIKTEKVSYKAFQRNFGRSVQRRAPGMFISILKRKAESAGASVIEFSTYHTKLSQYDHTTGEFHKKPLSQRYHEFPDGTRVQRDLYSAWLARYVENDRLDASQLKSDWAAAEPLLRQAASSFNQSAKKIGSTDLRGENRQSGSPVKGVIPFRRGHGGVA
jgi:transposase